MRNEIKRTMHKIPLHYAYRPDSYSMQARALCDRAIDNVNHGMWCLEQAFRFFNLSYRCARIRFRALRRFNRYVKCGKVHETDEAAQNWLTYKKESDIEYYESLTGHYMQY